MVLRRTQRWPQIGLMCCSLLATAGCATKPKVADNSAATKYTAESPGAKPSNAKASPQLNLAYARLQEKDNNTVGARNSYERVLAENPKSTEAMIGLAHLDQMAGRPELAETRLKEAYRLDPKSPQTLNALGHFYASEKRWSLAVASYQQALAGSPDDKNTRYYLAVALARSGQTNESMPHFVQSVGTAAAHYNIGVILYERGDLRASEEHLVLAVATNPGLEQAQFYLDELQKNNGSRTALASGRSTGERPAYAGYQTPADPAASSGNNVSSPPPYTGNGPQINAGRSDSQQSFAPIATGGGRPTTPPQARSGSEPPAGLTPQQWEQWNNQRAGR